MKRLLRSWVFWAFVVLPPTAVVLMRGARVETRSECGDCLTGWIRSRWVLHVKDAVTLPLSGTAEEVHESHGFQDRLIGPHAHRWRPRGESWTSLWGSDRTPADPGYWMLLRFMTDEVVRPTPPLLRSYEQDPAFREFIRAKFRRGEATKDDCRAVLTLPEWGLGDVAERRSAWLAEFERGKKGVDQPR